ncbi:PDR/VanB family oxidoreductase [Saccharothrix variisporea]|uniref:Ferredoxin-NADP reductase n=1 Tax=Saccharothrix variisporea TaxID=543527 RepID=A0A495XDL3_9PSEU|nr:PDR/VanB family oxidoreductase [Saccharothrix variisporea]RKT72561.1 ferredoxin-NADP reductase [Saccharothrix variisporea]
MDGFVRGLEKFTDGYLKALRHFGSARPDRAVDRLLRLTVAQRREEVEDVVSLRLSGPELPAWQPGCHLDLHLPSGLRRQYSLCGDPRDRTSYRIAVRRVGTGSAEVHALREGDEVVVRGPRNAFPFVPEGPMLFLAGGIGITPILAMVREAARLGVEHTFVYCGRSRATMPFLDELPDHTDVRPDDERGLPDVEAIVGTFPAHGSVYCCGPTPMLDAVRRAFASRRLHFERFAPPPITDGRPFALVLRRSGITLDVPANRSALDVLKDLRPTVPYSCRQGFCGTCEVDGVRVCVARPTGDRLVLDL